MNYQKLKQVYAIKEKYKSQLLKLNPKLDNESGIYFFIRKSEQNENEIYVGQSVTILNRCVSHMQGYEQYIDKSIKAHKLYDAEKNPHGYKIEFLHFPKNELDEKEQYYIKLYSESGWILKNKTSGSQGKGKEKIAEYKPPKTYRQGIQQGRKNLAKELSSIIDKHLIVEIKEEKKGNKVSERMLEKFNSLINEDSYKESD